MAFNQAGHESASLRIFSEFSQKLGAGGIRFLGSDGLLNGSEAAL
jgi:hypothetical protein